MLDAIQWTAKQTRHCDLLFTIGQFQQLIVFLPCNLMNAQNLRPSGSCKELEKEARIEQET